MSTEEVLSEESGAGRLREAEKRRRASEGRRTEIIDYRGGQRGAERRTGELRGRRRQTEFAQGLDSAGGNTGEQAQFESEEEEEECVLTELTASLSVGYDHGGQNDAAQQCHKVCHL